MPEVNGKPLPLDEPEEAYGFVRQTVTSIRPGVNPGARRMNPGTALLLVIALVSGFLKLFMPWLGLRWEFCYLLVGVAAVLVLDSIRAAIPDR